MPEGHTIHRIATDHARLLVGREIVVTSPQGRFEMGAAHLAGRRVERIDAYGKHLFQWWTGGEALHIHLGLFGKFRVAETGCAGAPTDATRVRWQTATTTIDLSGPNACELLVDDEVAAIVARLGPDPLRADAHVDLALRRIAASHRPIGDLLLDQAVLAGVGNVYRAEALFVTGIWPERSGSTLAVDELQVLWSTIVRMLRQGVKDNRIVTVDPRELGTTKAKLPAGKATYVYKREMCLRCATAIVALDLGGRSCYACPTCQRRPGRRAVATSMARDRGSAARSGRTRA
jgi:endonuclease VIII